MNVVSKGTSGVQDLSCPAPLDLLFFSLRDAGLSDSLARTCQSTDRNRLGRPRAGADISPWISNMEMG